ncbi:MAG TPA: ABC transporter permease [Streptosporangiaceae bacterium]|nr:ABC transporter permease [Streptosporangiaceae bacterium]
MAAPLDVSPVEATAASAAALGGGAIEGRSLSQIAWRRFRRDKVAIGGGVVVILLVITAFLAPVLTKHFGESPDTFNPGTINPNLEIPLGRFGGISLNHLLGVEPSNGRDLFSRVLYGAQISLLIAFLATLLSVAIGVVLGIIAGYFGGWQDALISRTMDVFLAFPLLIFAIALSSVVQQRAFGLTGNTLHVSVLVFIIGFFNWPYMGRIIRGQTLSLREREYVDAARSLGARSNYILFHELFPNLVAPILVYSTLLIPANILFEAALSFLGVGIQPPTPSWGAMLFDAVNWYQVDPEYMLVPGLAIFITVLAFNLFGDGLRDALDPRAR